MSTTEYLLNGVLIALVVLQIRGRRMSLRLLLLPLAIVGWVAIDYLHSVPTGGNDVLLAALGAAVGLALGTGCGLATTVRRGADGVPMAKAGLLAAVLWVAGVGARVAFSLYATHGGGAAIVRFSASNHITGTQAWVVCLVLMALIEVLSRTAVLATKYWRLRRGSLVPADAPSAGSVAARQGHAMMEVGGQQS